METPESEACQDHPHRVVDCLTRGCQLGVHLDNLSQRPATSGRQEGRLPGSSRFCPTR